MKKIIYITLCVMLFASCQQNEVPNKPKSECVLILELACANRQISSTRAIDSDLAVSILDNEGNPYCEFLPGEIPTKIVLEPGQFIIRAYTDNQETWQEANNGRGEACYYVEYQVKMNFDEIRRDTISVPMINYAVSLKLPEYFHNLFNSHTFALISGNRNTSIQEGETAYFNPSDGGFAYSLQATNIDGVTHSHSAYKYSDVQSGKHYVVKYVYGLDANTGGVDIEIKDDMQMEDTDVEI